MKRRHFIILLGGGAAWPLAARGQQSSGQPLIGILSPLSAGTATRNVEGFRAGMRELGYLEGRNVSLALRFAEGLPECGQHPAGVIGVKKINRRRVLAFQKADLQLAHEADHGHPEIIPHHHDTFHPAAVALPQGLHQLRVLFLLLGVQPLLELIENNQHFEAGRNASAPAKGGERLFQSQVAGQTRALLSQSAQDSSFGFRGRRLDVDLDHVVR